MSQNITIVVYEKATLKEIEKVMKKVMRDCHKWNVPIGKRIVLDQTIAPVESSYYARTGQTDKGIHVVTFSARLFLDYQHDIDEAMRNIAAHELCHTCKDGMNHGKGWKQWVSRLNEHGYHINPKPYSKNEAPGMY